MDKLISVLGSVGSRHRVICESGHHQCMEILSCPVGRYMRCGQQFVNAHGPDRRHRSAGESWIGNHAMSCPFYQQIGRLRQCRALSRSPLSDPMSVVTAFPLRTQGPRLSPAPCGKCTRRWTRDSRAPNLAALAEPRQCRGWNEVGTRYGNLPLRPGPIEPK